MKVRITYQGTAYELDVEILGAHDQPHVPVVAAPAPPSAAPAPQTAQSLAPAPKASKPMAAGALGRTVNSPMAGVVLAIKVKPGDQVAEGQDVITLEAMKMETSIVSPYSGTVKAVLVQPRQGVGSDEPLIQFE